MGLLGGDLVPMTNKSRVKKLEKTANLLQKERAELVPALQKVQETSERLEATITGIKDHDLAEADMFYDTLDISDKNYVETQFKQTHRQRKQEALDILTPLKETCEKIKGHVYLANDSASYFFAVVQAQIDLYESGKIPIEIFKKLRDEGLKLDIKIKELLSECERINSNGQRALKSIGPLKPTTVAAAQATSYFSRSTTDGGTK